MTGTDELTRQYPLRSSARCVGMNAIYQCINLLLALSNYLFRRAFRATGSDMKNFGNTDKTTDVLQIAAGKIQLAADWRATAGGDNERLFYTK